MAIKKVMDPGKRLAKKKSENGGDPVKEGYTLPEFTKTASRIVDKPSKAPKVKDWTRKVYRANKEALKRSGAGSKKVVNILGMKKRF